jgi:hypothetical protein
MKLRLLVAKRIYWPGVRHLAAFCFSTDHKTVAQIAESQARKIMRFVHLLIGPIEYLPLTSPVMDHRVRSRHKTEIAELTDLG